MRAFISTALVVLSLIAASFATPPAKLQTPPISTPPPAADASRSDADPQFGRTRDDQFEKEAERRRDKALAEERFRNLKRDAEKLLELATELKQYVDKSGEHVLSVDVLKKAEEMEKLAKDLKNRMKGQ